MSDRSLITFDIDSAVARAVSFLSANLCSDLRVPSFSNLQAPRSPSTDLSSVSGCRDLRAQTSLPSLRPPRSPSADVSSESQAATITEAEITRAQTSLPSLREPQSPSADISSKSLPSLRPPRSPRQRSPERRPLFRVSGRHNLRAQTSLPSLRPPRSPSADISSESQAHTITEAEITRAQTSLPSLRVPRSPSAYVSSESQAATISKHRCLFRVSGRHDHRGRDHPSADLSQAAAISSADRVI